MCTFITVHITYVHTLHCQQTETNKPKPAKHHLLTNDFHTWWLRSSWIVHHSTVPPQSAMCVGKLSQPDKKKFIDRQTVQLNQKQVWYHLEPAAVWAILRNYVPLLWHNAERWGTTLAEKWSTNLAERWSTSLAERWGTTLVERWSTNLAERWTTSLAVRWSTSLAERQVPLL